MMLESLLEKELEQFPGPFPLTSLQKADLLTYARQLKESPHKSVATWNSDSEGICMHFRDAILSLPDCQKGRLLDIGSGAGLPGILYTIFCPGFQTVLLDASRKPVQWIKSCLLDLSIKERTEVLQDRAEVLGFDPAHREQYDLVTARALAKLGACLELCAPFVKTGGMLHLLRGCEDEAWTEQMKHFLGVLGLDFPEKKSYLLQESKQPRYVYSFRKIRPTKDIYPRSNAQIKRGISKA